MMNKTMGNLDMVQRFKEVMAYTSRYKDDDLGGLNIDSLPRLGGDYTGERIGSAHYGLHSGRESRNELWQVEGPATTY